MYLFNLSSPHCALQVYGAPDEEFRFTGSTSSGPWGDDAADKDASDMNTAELIAWHYSMARETDLSQVAHNETLPISIHPLRRDEQLKKMKELLRLIAEAESKDWNGDSNDGHPSNPITSISKRRPDEEVGQYQWKHAATSQAAPLEDGSFTAAGDEREPTVADAAQAMVDRNHGRITDPRLVDKRVAANMENPAELLRSKLQAFGVDTTGMTTAQMMTQFWKEDYQRPPSEAIDGQIITDDDKPLPWNFIKGLLHILKVDADEELAIVGTTFSLRLQERDPDWSGTLRTYFKPEDGYEWRPIHPQAPEIDDDVLVIPISYEGTDGRQRWAMAAGWMRTSPLETMQLNRDSSS
ncbi:hypothetical protein THAOC_18814 [Thalassiosira oceanica]|uniref:Uncharacterized protein n=1 Tax=Thalassiosira oceanica TaxID=159749 RepID=K0S3Y8_THAOC|nr:hypothetical protein THAOC_18814 [Thalassiosira oceanica]|eukprot:EJK60778.1 hypothetical protein THAOC_18814 [Thalassiosira oceanica]